MIQTASKTLIYTDVATEEYSMSLEDSEEIDQENYIRKITLEALPDLINNLGSTMDFKVSDEPWTGRIVAVDGDTIMINAGKEIGLEDEAVFEGIFRGRIHFHRHRKNHSSAGDNSGRNQSHIGHGETFPGGSRGWRTIQGETVYSVETVTVEELPVYH